MIWSNFTLILTIVLFNSSNSQVIYKPGFIGCFESKVFDHEFNTYSPHSSGEIISPIECQKSCYLMGFELASIEKNDLCFCKKGIDVKMEKILEENCQSYVCQGDSNYYCGSDTSILVYSTQIFIQKLEIDLDNKSNNHYSLEIISEASILYTINNYGTISSYDGSKDLNTTNVSVMQFIPSIELEYIQVIATMHNDITDLDKTRVLKIHNKHVIESLNADCPFIISSDDNLRCKIEIFGYSEAEIRITADDGFMESLKIPRPLINLYGSPVSQNIMKSQIQTISLNPNLYYLLYNGQIMESCLLKSIEVYSNDEFDLKFHMVEFKDLSKKSDLKLYQCTAKFSKVNTSCDNFHVSDYFNGSIIFRKTFNLTLKKGYNLVYSNQLSETREFLDQNWFILLEPVSNGQLLVSPFNQNGSDHSISKNDSSIENLRKRIMFSVNTENYHVINSYNSFKNHGNRSVQFQIFDQNSSKILNQINRNFTVIEPISDLVIEPHFRSCSVDRLCEFKSKAGSGSDIDYQWSINSNLTDSMSNYLSFKFSKTGVYLIKLDAWNNVSFRSAQINYTINEGLQEVYFHSGDRDISTSITNQSALFLFKIRTVQDYTCVTNFGDSLKNFNFSDKEKDLNNEYVNYTYSKPGFYSVSITCYQGTDSLGLKLIHIVQDEITGFGLLEKGIDLSTVFYRIGFRFKTGTNISVILGIDSVTNSETTFDGTSLIGYSGLLVNYGYARILNVSIKAYNLVSLVSVSEIFEISSSLVSPELIITPFEKNYVYEFEPAAINYTVKVQKGNNVKVEFFFGNEKSSEPSVSRLFAGTWLSDFVYTYTHPEPGDYIVRVKVSNVFSNFDFFRRISFISQVDQLTCYPAPGIVLLKFSRAYVEFRVKSIGISDPGSRATVKFWPGDSANLTYGPFMIGMKNFVNSIPFSYTYSQLGNFRPILLIENEISKKYFQLSVMVVSSSVDDMYAVIKPPAVMINQSFKVYVYLLNALDVNITWDFENMTIVQNQISKKFSIGDSQEFNSGNTVRNALISITARDRFTNKTINSEVYIQNPIKDFEIYINPSDPIASNLNQRGKEIKFFIELDLDVTNPFFLVNFDDDSVINFEQEIINGSTSFNHFFKLSGIYKVNVTIFNKVSNLSKIIQIEILEDFLNFDCIPTWRLYPFSFSDDYNISKIGEFYLARKEYDIRFKCRWSNKNSPVDYYDIKYGSHFFNTSLFDRSEILKTDDFAEIVITLNSNILKNEQDNQVVITIRNNLFSKSYRAMIKPVSTIKGLTPLKDNTITGKNELRTLRFSFESLGEPSCSLITQDINGFKNFLFTIGSDQETCRAYYPYIEFKEKYQVAESRIWIFTLLLEQTGLMNIEAFIKNEYTSASISSSVTVSNIDCNRPQVEIENRSSFFYQPRIIPRSKRFSIVGITKINCKLSLQNIRQWTLFLVKESNGEEIQQFSIVSNPTSSFSELVIPSKSLPYGLYKFVYKVKMLGQNIDLTAFQVETDTYVKIVPSGVVVQVFPSGMTKIRRGIDQNIILDPTFYSYDLDSVYPVKNLKFKYFCYIFENGILVKSPKISLDRSIDLSSIKLDFQRYSNNSCFDSPESFSFDLTENILNIPARGLSYMPARQYMFTIMTSYLQKNYSQNVFIEIDSYSNVPVINIRCKFLKECTPYENYLLINPVSKLMIVGECESGCEYINSLEYEYRIFKRWIISDFDNLEKWVALNLSNYASLGRGAYSNELTIFNDLFLENLNDIFQIEFIVKTMSISNGISLGSASLFLSVNKPPKNGSCGISPLSGFSGSTIFTIECQDWYDSDGFIDKYEFYVNYLNNPRNTTLGFSEVGFFETFLPDGPSFDQNRISIFAKVMDNLNSHSIYSLGSVTVFLNKSDSMRLIQEIEQNNEESVIKRLLHESNSVHTLRNLVSFVFSLNELSRIDKKSLIEARNNPNLFLTTFGPKTNVSFESNFEDINAIVANFLVSETINITSKDYETRRNTRASIRENLVNFISNISLLDVASVKFKSDLLAEITADSSEITRETSIQATQQILGILDTINLIEAGIYEQDMVDIVNNLANSMANILQGLSTMVNERQPSLRLDFIRANTPPSEYDTDLENFWSNPNNFLNNDQTEISDQIIAENKNILIQKFQTREAIVNGKKIIDTLTINLAEYSSLGNPIQISTTSIQMSVNRVRASDLNVFLFEGLGKIELPSFCDLVGYNQTTIWNFSNYFDWNDLNNCTNELLTVQIVSKASAPSGFNSDNETKIGLSNSLSLKFFNSEKIEIPIRNSIKPIHLYIPRDPSVSFPEFYFVNTSGFDNTSQFLANQFNISTSNASLHINLRPLDNFTGYFMTMKLGSIPIIKENITNLDKWEIFCPNEEQFSSNRTFQFFMNKSEINGFKGFVGVGIRELNVDEFDHYCISKIKSKNQMPDYVQNVTFNNDFYLRFYSSGCYYLDDETGWWTSHGIEVMPDTNEKYTHCMTKHLTEFAGGLVILPTEINFKYVFANASLTKNPVIYTTVIVLTCVYLLFVIWGRYQDTVDSKKIGVCLLKDNQPLDSYFYEVIVFSGSRTYAETDSRVTIILSGDCDDTKPRILEDPKRKCFRRGGVDSFILSTSQSLGNLNYVRVWHDNSGEGNKASWYLKFILIRDLQTDKKYYFMCQNWLAVEKYDGAIDRILPVIYDLKSTNLKTLIDLQTKQDIADDHIWFSIFTRPVQSSFSRVERITCCFVLLFVTMFINILYYEKESTFSINTFQIGYFLLSTEQLATGLISSVLIFVPNLVLVEMFRRSKRRTPKYREVTKQLRRSLMSKKIVIGKLDRTEKLSIENDSKKSKLKFGLKFPWWFKIIGFVISFLLIGVSIFFIIVKGIEFGNEKVGKWLSSLIISVMASIFLTQPAKVILLGVFCVLIFRKPKNYDENEDEDKIKLENEPSDGLDLFKEKNVPLMKSDKDLDQIELLEARKDRLRQLKFKIIIRELLTHLVFLSLIYMCAFAYKDNFSFRYQKAVRNLFLDEKFRSMANTEQFWTWTRERLSIGLRAQPWYNGDQPYGFAGFVNDFNSRLIGYGILRQLRVKEDTCILKKNVKDSINFCEKDYSIFSEENRDFGLEWSKNFSNFTPTTETKRVFDAFKYTNSEILESHPYFGVYNTYSGGGYVYELRGSLQQMNDNLSLLQNISWIDRKTRAVFVEFTLFNPNIQLLCVSTILIEFLPTGNLVKSARMEPVNLFNDFEKLFSYRTLVKFFYFLMVMFFLIKEIILIFRKGFAYFKNPWSYVEICIQFFSWLCLGVYIHRYLLYNRIFEFFNKTSGFGYIRLQNLTYWNDIFTMSISVCVALTTFKFVKLLRFSPRLSLLAATIKCATDELISFGILFLIVWLSMVQVFYLYFFDKMIGFSTMVRSMETCFQIMLGKFQVDPLMKAHKILGPVFFIFYNFTIVFIYMNLLISIVNETFMMVKRDAEHHFYKYDFLNYLIRKFGFVKGIFRKNNKISLEMCQVQASSFQDNVTLFPKKSSQLIDLVGELYGEQLIIDYIYQSQIDRLRENKSKNVKKPSNITLANKVRQASRNIVLNEK